MPSNKNYRYLLGDSQAEAARLRAQSKLWDPVSFALFDRLRIKRGMTILEIGPGKGSLHMELRRRAGRPIDAVERSAAFATDLVKLCKRDKLGEGMIQVCDLLGATLPANHYDLIFARWVFLFLPDPLTHLKKLERALKPGGRIAIQDYHRPTLSMVPTPAEWNDFIAADEAFFASQGGDASIAAKLPALFKKVGMKTIEMFPTIKTGHPGSPPWNWMTNYFFGVIDDLAKFPPFTRAKAKSLRRQWEAAMRDPTSLLISPTILDVVAVRQGAP